MVHVPTSDSLTESLPCFTDYLFLVEFPDIPPYHEILRREYPFHSLSFLQIRGRVTTDRVLEFQCHIIRQQYLPFYKASQILDVVDRPLPVSCHTDQKHPSLSLIYCGLSDIHTSVPFVMDLFTAYVKQFILDMDRDDVIAAIGNLPVENIRFPDETGDEVIVRLSIDHLRLFHPASILPVASRRPCRRWRAPLPDHESQRSS